DERIVGVEITLGQLAAAGIGRAPADRDMGVLAHEQRVEAAFLERARQFVDGDAVIGRKVEGANQHSPPIARVTPGPPRAVGAISGGRETYSMRPPPVSCRTPRSPYNVRSSPRGGTPRQQKRVYARL